MDEMALRALLAVQDLGSIASAADRLGVSRSTIRRRLDELEARVGTALFHRHASGITLTDAGVVLSDHARRSLEDNDAVIDRLRSMAGEPAGTAHIVLPNGLRPQLVVLLTSWMRDNAPGIHIRFRFRQDPFDLLRSGEVDLAICQWPRIPEGPWTASVVFRAPMQLLASRPYLDAHGTPKTIEEVLAHPLLLWSSQVEGAHTLPLADGTHVPVEPLFVLDDVHLIRQLALHGAGIAWVGSGAPDVGFPPDHAVDLLPELVQQEFRTWLVVPSARVRIRKVSVVADLARSVGDFMAAMSAMMSG
jgi:DNA-binding transcriptional LysR family regulator